MDLNISPEELKESSGKILQYSEQLEAALKTIDKAAKSLDGWKSPTKNMYLTNIDAKMPKMKLVVEAARSYGSVGQEVALRVLGVEESLKKQVNNMDNVA